MTRARTASGINEARLLLGDEAGRREAGEGSGGTGGVRLDIRRWEHATCKENTAEENFLGPALEGRNLEGLEFWWLVLKGEEFGVALAQCTILGTREALCRFIKLLCKDGGIEKRTEIWIPFVAGGDGEYKGNWSSGSRGAWRFWAVSSGRVGRALTCSWRGPGTLPQHDRYIPHLFANPMLKMGVLVRGRERRARHG